MTDVVLTLRFDTKAGSAQVQKLAAETKAALTRALTITPKSADLARALGIKPAITDVRRLQTELQKLNRTFFGGQGRNALGQLTRRSAGISPLEREKTQFSSLGKTAAGQALAASGGSFLGFKEEGAKGGAGGATTSAVLDFQKLELKNIQLRIREDIRAAAAISKANAEVVAAKQLQSQTIIANTRRMQGLDKRTGFFEETRASQAGIATRNADRVRTQAGGFAGMQLQQRLQSVSPVAKAERTEQRRQAALAFAEAQKRSTAFETRRNTPGFLLGRGKAGEAPGGLNPGETFKNFLPGGSRGPAKAGRITPQQALGISTAATNLLALSSVLGPLNAQLGAVTMQAGFAAFSLGAPIAALSLLASTLAGFGVILKKSVSAAKEANLETIGWSRSTIKLKLEMQGFLKVIGIETQRAFGPVVDQVKRLFQEIEGLPWESLITTAASLSTAMLNVLEVWTKFAKGMVDTAIFLHKEFGKLAPPGANVAGLPSLFQVLTPEAQKEILAARAKRDEEGGQFRFTPKFQIRNVEDVGKTIQSQILKAESKDPLLRATEAQNAILRNMFILNEDQAKSLREILEAAGQRLVIP